MKKGTNKKAGVAAGFFLAFAIRLDLLWCELKCGL